MLNFEVVVSLRHRPWVFTIQAHDFIAAMDLVDEMTEGVEYTAISIQPY